MPIEIPALSAKPSRPSADAAVYPPLPSLPKTSATRRKGPRGRRWNSARAPKIARMPNAPTPPDSSNGRQESLLILPRPRQHTAIINFQPSGANRMALQTTNNIWHNGNLIPWDKAQIHVMSHVVHYGSSVFEGIRCYTQPNGACVFRLQEHMARLLDS